MKPEERPWGSYRVLHEDKNFQVKRIEIKPRSRFSLQKHFKREEKWTIASGDGLVTLGELEIPVQAGSVIEIGIGVVHRIQNIGKEPLVFIEVQFGDYLGEDDIVRLADDFSRA